jgi:pyruvate-formate lyase-activating enzyme
MAVTLLGNGPEMHDRLAGVAGSFAKAAAQLAKADEVYISLRRANAFHLAAIVQFACAARGRDDEFEAFDPHPATTLAQRFGDHLIHLRNVARACHVRIDVDDKMLLPLFAHIAERATVENEPDLLRLLGVLCDTALVGPRWFVFEVINRCNARCRYCNIHAPSRRPGADFLDRQLDFALFAPTVDALARLGAEGVTILANGEPTLHPDFARMIRYARARGLRVNFFTNGLCLDEDVARVIVETGAEEMFCTISAASAETYAALHADVTLDDWDRVLNNLRRLFALRRDARTGRPTSWMVNVICRANAAELLEMAELAGALGFNGLRPQLLRVDEHNRDLALGTDDVARLRETLPRLQQRCAELGLQLWDGFAFQLAHAGERPDEWSGDTFVERGCFIGWALGLAKANGDLSFCCTVKPVANLADGPFAELWAGGLYQRARLAAKDLRRAGDLRLRDGSPLYTDYCRHCDNHDVNRRMHDLMDQYDLWRFLG